MILTAAASAAMRPRLLPARVHASTAFPGYGWIFGLGDGSVNVGLGRLPPQAGPHGPDLARVLTAWVGSLPADWGLCEENALSDPRGVGLPMGFTRRPQYARGLLVAGDAGGMANPGTGEGIAYAMESGKLAAESVLQALARPQGPDRERALAAYPAAVSAAWGSHFRLAGWVGRRLSAPGVPEAASRALRHPALGSFLIRMLVGLNDPHEAHLADRAVSMLVNVVPALR